MCPRKNNKEASAKIHQQKIKTAPYNHTHSQAPSPNKTKITKNNKK